jgi:hypothetical protein
MESEKKRSYFILVYFFEDFKTFKVCSNCEEIVKRTKEREAVQKSSSENRYVVCLIKKRKTEELSS